jgi:NAD-reducing hydrogenase large subunit
MAGAIPKSLCGTKSCSSKDREKSACSIVNLSTPTTAKLLLKILPDEARLRHSYVKALYYKPKGFPDGVYRVGPLARINVADQFGTPLADVELKDFRQRFGHPAHSAFLYHYARLLEIIHAFEKIELLLADWQIHDKQVRARGGVNSLEEVGMIEAPRGILIHHYKVNEDGAITWANLIVATGHNNLAIGGSVQQVGEHFIDGNKLQEGMLNRVSAAVRAYDPCLAAPLTR